jgi:hypothetical protein
LPIDFSSTLSGAVAAAANALNQPMNRATWPATGRFIAAGETSEEIFP